jgi:predicted aspartyl protease
VFRPFVQISLASADRSTAVLDGLIDTGADTILASDLLADQLDSISKTTTAKPRMRSAGEP